MINFELPQDLIAQTPAIPRDSAKLLVYDRARQRIVDSVFSDIDSFLVNGTTIVMNNSKVEHCRWLFDDAKTEVFVLEKLDQYTVRGLVRPGKKFKKGRTVQLTPWLQAEVADIDTDGIRTLRLSTSHDDSRLRKIEHIPLPPYITQNDQLAAEYQTVYAKPLGSKAAPTAGLHFTDSLLSSLAQTHQLTEVTLHVGLGTFAPLSQSNLESGKLHSEHYSISDAAAAQLMGASHITAVGTTTTRTLESWAVNGSQTGDTDIFIQPGYDFKKVDSMITNFHLPGTSLLLMIEAFFGSAAETQRIYDHAIKNSYRFYSFGDAMLII